MRPRRGIAFMPACLNYFNVSRSRRFPACATALGTRSAPERFFVGLRRRGAGDERLMRESATPASPLAVTASEASAVHAIQHDSRHPTALRMIREMHPSSFARGYSICLPRRGVRSVRSSTFRAGVPRRTCMGSPGELSSADSHHFAAHPV